MRLLKILKFDTPTSSQQFIALDMFGKYLLYQAQECDILHIFMMHSRPPWLHNLHNYTCL